MRDCSVYIEVTEPLQPQMSGMAVGGTVEPAAQQSGRRGSQAPGFDPLASCGRADYRPGRGCRPARTCGRASAGLGQMRRSSSWPADTPTASANDCPHARFGTSSTAVQARRCVSRREAGAELRPSRDRSPPPRRRRMARAIRRIADVAACCGAGSSWQPRGARQMTRTSRPAASVPGNQPDPQPSMSRAQGSTHGSRFRRALPAAAPGTAAPARSPRSRSGWLPRRTPRPPARCRGT
jgi:hypothetical protein